MPTTCYRRWDTSCVVTSTVDTCIQMSDTELSIPFKPSQMTCWVWWQKWEAPFGKWKLLLCLWCVQVENCKRRFKCLVGQVWENSQTTVINRVFLGVLWKSLRKYEMLKLCTEDGQEVSLSRISVVFCHGEKNTDKRVMGEAGYPVMYELMRT